MRRLLIPLVAAGALAASAAPAKAQDPVNLFALENFVTCSSAPGSNLSTCSQRLATDASYHVYTCYGAARRILVDGDVGAYRACLNAETRRATRAKARKRRR